MFVYWRQMPKKEKPHVVSNGDTKSRFRIVNITTEPCASLPWNVVLSGDSTSNACVSVQSLPSLCTTTSCGPTAAASVICTSAMIDVLLATVTFETVVPGPKSTFAPCLNDTLSPLISTRMVRPRKPDDG